MKPAQKAFQTASILERSSPVSVGPPQMGEVKGLRRVGEAVASVAASAASSVHELRCHGETACHLCQPLISGPQQCTVRQADRRQQMRIYIADA
jgi:hypothetical protein